MTADDEPRGFPINEENAARMRQWAESERAEPKGCPVKVWDGPYSYRCGLGATVGLCAYHGPFDPSLVRRSTREARGDQ